MSVVPASVRVFVDGSALATRGPGGIGFVVPDLDLEGSLELSAATNQQAELLAAAYALSEIPEGLNVVVVSDSQYVVRGWGWLPGWIAKGWRTNSGPVANPNYWRRLQLAVDRHESVVFEWVKGHADTPENERADRLAYAARMSAKEKAAA